MGHVCGEESSRRGGGCGGGGEAVAGVEVDLEAEDELVGVCGEEGVVRGGGREVVAVEDGEDDCFQPCGAAFGICGEEDVGGERLEVALA